MQKLEEFQITQEQRQAAEKTAKARAIIQRVKDEVLPIEMKVVIPPHILSLIYMEMEKVLSKMDIRSLPFSELVLIGEGIKDRLVGEFLDELRPAFHHYFLSIAQKQLNQSMRLTYQAYTKAGGPLSYRDFLCSCLAGRPADEIERFFDMVDPVYRPVSQAELEEMKAIEMAMSRH
jgi:hypothetical protein